jgi:Ca2+-binding RTX toxin-like protein
MISGSLFGGGNSLMGGSGNDTMWGGGGFDTLTAGNTGSDLLISGPGSDSMVGSSAGGTSFEIAYHTGNDTINASGSGNVVYIDSRNYFDANTTVTDVPGSGNATVTFTDTGQVLQINGVQDIVFNDHDFKPT